MTSSKIFLYFCLSFIGGIFLSSFAKASEDKSSLFNNFPQLLTLGSMILGLILISVFWQYKKFVVIGFSILFLVLGAWRYQVIEIRISKSELQNYNDKEEIITLVGTVSEEPDVRDNNVKLTIKPEKIDGKVLITTNKYPEYKYGDRLKIKGRLEAPPQFEDFNYKDYLAKDGIYSVISYPEIELIEKNQENPAQKFMGVVLGIKDKLREVITQNLSPPQSSILGALILGDKRQISPEWNQKLNYAGVRHITAVSGMHVAILTSILMSFLIGIGLWRRQAFYFAIILITLFIIMTGLQASAVRAGVMGTLFLLAQYLGRMNVSSRAIVFAAAIMLAQNPLLLKLDVGFQLSFLAMMGIIYLSPVFQNCLRKIPDFLQAKSILAMTLSAQIFTLPILIYNFGYLSLVAPITNILILPFLPFIMGSGFLFGILGIIFQPLGLILSLPCWLLLTYLTKIVDWFSSLSFAAFHFEISWFWPLLFYLILGVTTWRWQEKQKLKFLKY